MICLDSSFLIDFIRGDKNAVRKLESIKDEVIVTTGINVFEIFFGFYISHKKTDFEIIKDLFSNILILNLDYQSAINASKIGAELSKSGKIIELNDILISGIILANGCNSILTNNKEHFSRVKGLSVINY